MLSRILRIFIIVILILVNNLFAQDILNTKDPSKIKVDEIGDADILRFKQQLQSAGITMEQAEQIALAKGFPPSELFKLRQRLANVSTANNNPSSSTANNGGARTVTQTETSTATTSGNLKIFGSELFTTSSLAFQPNLKIATPVNYEIGPDDVLQVSVYGLQEASFNLTVSPEGTIYIPNVGMIKVSGETIESATSKIRSRMSSIAYGSLKNGASKLSVTLGNIRSIRITILGAVKPGTYTISSLSTLFNALYLAGGPAPNGSYREIELLRNNKIERRVDLYNFLLTGSYQDDVRLRENDVIRIPVYKKRVEIDGEVKRPGIFELLPKETALKLIQFASGFTDSAYRASIKVIQVTDRERRVKDLDAAEFAVYEPNPADYFDVSKILNRFQNRVSITGAVFRPGLFEITPNLTVGELIRKAEGLREDAYARRAQILRLQNDLTTEIISFDASEVLQGGYKDIILKREDQVRISSIFDLKDQHNVTIQGEVRRPGSFVFADSLTLKDLILQAGGFSEAAYPQKIEIARLIRRDTLTASDKRLSEIIEVRSLDDLSLTSKNLSLEPFDVVTVRRMPGFLELRSVTAIGQFQYPGPYVLSYREERVSDLLKRAGGFAPEAFPDGAYLRRVNERTLTADLEMARVEKIQQQLKDSTGQLTASVGRRYDQIPLDLNKIITHPGTDIDLILRPGDELFVPRNDVEIRVTGEVLFPTQAPFNKNDDLGDYISSAGGFTDNARKNKLYVLYPNGKAAKTSHFLFFRNYPEIKPGSEVIVPKKIEKIRTSRSGAETALLVSALASIAGIVIGLARLFQ